MSVTVNGEGAKEVAMPAPQVNRLRAERDARILEGIPNSEAIMTSQEFFQQLDARIAQFDLLCHPFYKAWSAGELSRDDLRSMRETTTIM